MMRRGGKKKKNLLKISFICFLKWEKYLYADDLFNVHLFLSVYMLVVKKRIRGQDSWNFNPHWLEGTRSSSLGMGLVLHKCVTSVLIVTGQKTDSNTEVVVSVCGCTKFLFKISYPIICPCDGGVIIYRLDHKILFSHYEKPKAVSSF